MRNKLYHILKGMALCACLSLPVPQAHAGVGPSSGDGELELRIKQVEQAQNGAFFQPVLYLEVTGKPQADEALKLLRIYRQSEEGKPEREDVYLTAPTPALNEKLPATGVWTERVTLSPIPGGMRHYYTFSIVSTRKEYFSNTVKGETPPTVGNREETAAENHTIPVIFHLFCHKGLPSMKFDAETVHEWIGAANAALSNASGIATLTDTHLRLEAATQAPDGTPLQEAGICRSEATPTLCFDGRMDEITMDYPEMYWDENRYLNVYILPFALNSHMYYATYPQFPKGHATPGCQETDQPTAPHTIYFNSFAAQIDGAVCFLPALAAYLGVTEEMNNGEYGPNPMKNKYIGYTPQQAEIIRNVLQHAWSTPKMKGN